MANEVEIVVTAKDRATAGLRSVDRQAKGLGSTFKTVGAVASGFLTSQAVLSGFRVVTQYIGDSISAAADLEQAIGGTRAVFEDSGRVVEKFANKSATAIGMSEKDFREATTSIGTSIKRMTGDVEFAAEESVNLTKIGADLAATFGGTTKEAVEALGSAFRGEADPAERFGLDLKVGAVQAHAMEMGLGRVEQGSKGYADALIDLVEEQAKANGAMGQFSREQDTAAGKAQITKAKIEDQKAAVGEELLPAYSAFLEIQMDLVKYANKNFIPTLTDMSKTMTGEARGMSSAVQKHVGIKVPENYKKGTKAAKNFERQSKIALDDNVQNLGDFSRLWNSKTLTWGEKFGLIWRDIWAKNTKSEQRNLDLMLSLFDGRIVHRLSTNIRNWGRNTVDKFRSIWDSAKTATKNRLDKIVGFFRDLPSRIASAVSNLKSTVQKKVSSVLSGIKVNIKAALGIAGDGPGRGGGGNAIARARQAATGLPVYLTSSYRTPAHNARIGGSPTSYHLDKSNPAGDWGGPTWALDILHSRLRAMGGWRELIWRAPGHYDHVHAARSGGVRGGMTWVGEDGPELVKLPQGSTVYPSGQSATMASGGGNSPTVIQITADGTEASRALLQILKKSIRVKGGNVQMVLGS